MTRSCARPGCSQAAVATLIFDYGARTAWLDRLTEEVHPSNHDLCDKHASGLVVPRGWTLDDNRVVAPLFRDALAS